MPLQKRKSKPPRISRVLVTAGPTREMLDPVRFISNLSTGEMGYALAREAHRKGFQVTLISGPTSLACPAGVKRVSILTVADLSKALHKNFFCHDLLIMTAAVGDFIPLQCFQKKILRQKIWKMNFRQSPDLVAEIASRKGRRLVIGFSLETGNWLARSREKLKRKHLDGIVANYYSLRHNPFGSGPVHAALIDLEKTQIFKLKSKRALAGRVLNWAIALKGVKG